MSVINSRLCGTHDSILIKSIITLKKWPADGEIPGTNFEKVIYFKIRISWDLIFLHIRQLY